MKPVTLIVTGCAILAFAGCNKPKNAQAGLAENQPAAQPTPSPKAAAQPTPSPKDKAPAPDPIKDTQSLLIGTWEVPNNGSTLSFDAQNHVTLRVDVGGRSRIAYGTAQEGEMFYRLAKDEKTGLLSLYIKEGDFENKRFAIIAITDDSFDALYDGDEPLADRTVKWKRTSKEPSPLKPKQK